MNRLLVVPLLIIVMMVAVLGWRWHIDRQGRKQLEAVSAKLDETDPRWRWEDIEADRVEIPDVENASLLVAEFTKAVGLTRRFKPDEKEEAFDMAVHEDERPAHEHVAEVRRCDAPFGRRPHTQETPRVQKT